MALVELIKKAILGNKKLDVVVGDGIDPMRDIHGLYKCAYNDIFHKNVNRLYQLDKKSWNNYEHIRHYTTNARPTPAYDLVLHLARKGLLRSVVTTNYDSTLNSMFLRFKKDIASPVLMNPILAPGEWDYFGYCCEQLPADCIEFWKIHGSLDHIFCRGCETLLKCPDFVLPFGPRDITDEFNHPISHTYIPGKAKCCPIPKGPNDITGSLCDHYVHPTDWNIPDFQNTEPFKRIIESAMQRLRADTFGVIIIGFKGNKNYEEFNQVAEELDGKGIEWVMYLCNDQKEKVENGPEHCHLRDLVIRNRGDFSYYSVTGLADKIQMSMVDSGLVDMIELSAFEKHFANYYIEKEYWERL